MTKTPRELADQFFRRREQTRGEYLLYCEHPREICDLVEAVFEWTEKEMLCWDDHDGIEDMIRNELDSALEIVTDNIRNRLK